MATWTTRMQPSMRSYKTEHKLRCVHTTWLSQETRAVPLILQNPGGAEDKHFHYHAFRKRLDFACLEVRFGVQPRSFWQPQHCKSRTSFSSIAGTNVFTRPLLQNATSRFAMGGCPPLTFHLRPKSVVL